MLVCSMFNAWKSSTRRGLPLFFAQITIRHTDGYTIMLNVLDSSVYKQFK